MKNIFTVLTAGTMLFGASSGAFAAMSAMDAATQLAPCNGRDVVSARYLASGQLEVTCPKGSLTGLSGTGLTGTAAAGAAAGVLLLWVVFNDDDDSVSTTTRTGS